jgi:hypothetical protein
MRRFLFFAFLVLAFAALNGCVSASDPPRPFAGMSGTRLKARFGEPLRIERTPSGGEDWYYSFASWRHPDMDGSVSVAGASTAGSMSLTFSDQNYIQECPIHLSPEGYILEPLPVGKIVRK